MKRWMVYFISDNMGHIKIGMTNDTEKRLVALQTGCAEKLTLIRTIPVSTQNECAELESRLHDMFDFCRCNGEWFNEKPVIKYLEKDLFTVGDYTFKRKKKSEKAVFSVKIDSEVLRQWRYYASIDGYGDKGRLTEEALSEYMKNHPLSGELKEKFDTLCEMGA